MNHRLARIVVAIVAMLSIWQHYGMSTWGWIGFFVCLFFVGAGDRVVPRVRMSELVQEIVATWKS